jgi:calcium-dependent protein kinase
MGCLPAKHTRKVTLDGQDTNANGQKNDILNRSDLKINHGMLVQEGEGDPYEFYEETKILGEGTFGKVFKVRHKITKVYRAMKIINKQKAALGAEDEESLISEINILKSLDHPNIIKVYEYFNTKRKLFIISELCTGGELFDKITTVKHFSEQQASHIMHQLFSAVQFCHFNNIMHRDLKPENILIESEEEARKEFFTIKVIDFGTSDKVKKNKMFEKQIGTPFYIAPEVLNNKYNEKCDLWSCGVIMYILLCGVPPFFAEEESEIYALVKEGKFSMDGPEWDEISEDAKDLIRCLLKKDITKRYSAEQCMKHTWIRKLKHASKIDSTSNDKLKKITSNIKNFTANQKLQQATLAIIVHNMISKEDTDELRKCFMEFDDNGDGRLTKEELMKGLLKIMTPGEAKALADKTMNLIDVDENGFIEYEEFLRASLSKEKILTHENLKVAFNMFDKDKSGKINAQELKQVLGKEGQIKEKVWNQIINEIDVNGDGEISFVEFQTMMNKVASER